MKTRFKKLWHQTKFPLLIGGILTAVSCTPIILMTSNSIFHGGLNRRHLHHNNVLDAGNRSSPRLQGS